MTYEIEELSILRESLNHITIKGSDAKKIADLQLKLEQNISNLNTPKTTKRTTSK